MRKRFVFSAVFLALSACVGRAFNASSPFPKGFPRPGRYVLAGDPGCQIVQDQTGQALQYILTVHSEDSLVSERPRYVLIPPLFPEDTVTFLSKQYRVLPTDTLVFPAGMLFVRGPENHPVKTVLSINEEEGNPCRKHVFNLREDTCTVVSQ
ncbi:MAG: hypothetical protein A3J67_03370 [Parcubacteria group bacterium RIFCSPHIGHO2_02_FULL_48_10b]|nr:MAG: hypothetical protein A3J67_03370 [Parcubacteria group bacterium RIFCSPHIGHO2_02_FULL_48_10b]